VPSAAIADEDVRMPAVTDEPNEEPRWLTEAEMQAWVPLLRVVQMLPQVLDKQLREQAGVNHTHYMLLAHLSAEPEQRMPLTELARQGAMSPSRASHAVTGLEQRGWVERQPCDTDRRVQYIVLTDEGRALLQRTAPGHVAEARRTVIDHLDDTDLADLHRIASKILPVLYPDTHFTSPGDAAASPDAPRA
jgi:DNA-binding MarR family transcriptional regulator